MMGDARVIGYERGREVFATSVPVAPGVIEGNLGDVVAVRDASGILALVGDGVALLSAATTEVGGESVARVTMRQGTAVIRQWICPGDGRPSVRTDEGWTQIHLRGRRTVPPTGTPETVWIKPSMDLSIVCEPL